MLAPFPPSQLAALVPNPSMTQCERLVKGIIWHRRRLLEWYKSIVDADGNLIVNSWMTEYVCAVCPPNPTTTTTTSTTTTEGTTTTTTEVTTEPCFIANPSVSFNSVSRQLSWGTVIGATNYIVFIGCSSDASQAVAYSGTTAPVTAITLPSDGSVCAACPGSSPKNIYFFVKAYDNTHGCQSPGYGTYVYHCF